MSESEKNKSNDIPLRIPVGQRLLDSPFLLLAAGMVTMFAFYTIWGLYEVMTLPKGTLP